jgi:hypothetical protein
MYAAVAILDNYKEVEERIKVFIYQLMHNRVALKEF